MFFGLAMTFRTILAAMLFAFGGLSAASAATLSAADKATVSRIETYLNHIKSVRADFIQVASSGGFAEGRFYLRRPDKLRLDYAPPAKIQIYAGSYFLIYDDTELREVTQVPVDETLAGFLVRDKISLSGDVTVTGVTRSNGAIHVRLIKTDEPEAGDMVLTFGTDPLQLRQWTVRDAQGVETKISLIKPEYDVAIPDDVFRFDVTKYETPIRD